MLGTRVDRVFQPNRDELILAFRGFSAAYKLLISARANSARINLTTIPVENPQQPPMLCMLLRKKLRVQSFWRSRSPTWSVRSC